MFERIRYKSEYIKKYGLIKPQIFGQIMLLYKNLLKPVNMPFANINHIIYHNRKHHIRVYVY
jgi:hypothetical protein